MSSAINKCSLNAKYKAIEMRVLKENGSPLISMLNTRLIAQVPAVQLNSANVPPEIWATPKQEPVSPRISAKTAKALNENVELEIYNTLRYISQSSVESARMYEIMMTLNMHEMMCEVAEYKDFKRCIGRDSRCVHHDTDV